MQARRRWRGARRTAPRTTRRGRSRARAAGRAARASWRPAAAAAGRRCRGSRERDLGAQQVEAGALELVQRPGLRRRQQPERRRRTRRPAGSACAAASARSARRAGSPVSATARWRNAAAAASPPRACARPAERSSSAATSSSGPAAAAARCQARRSGSALAIGRLRQRQVRRPALVRRSPTGRPPSAPADGGTSRARRRRAARPVAAAAAASRCPSRSAARQQQQRIADRLGRRDEQQHAARRRAAPRAGGRKLSSIRPESACAPEQPEPARQLRRGQPSRQLEQRQRVAARLGDDPVADPLVQLDGTAEPAARARRRRAGRPTSSSGRSAQLLARLARGEHDPDRLGQQPPRDEGRASAPTPGRATARRRRRTAAAAPRPTSENRLSTASPTRNRSGAAPALSPNTISSAWRCGAGSARADRASARTADAGWRTASSISDSTPDRPHDGQVRGRRDAGTPAARSCRSRPRPAAPATGSAPPADAVEQPIEQSRSLAGRPRGLGFPPSVSDGAGRAAAAAPGHDQGRHGREPRHEARPSSHALRHPPGGTFPDYALPDHTGTVRTLSELQGAIR